MITEPGGSTLTARAPSFWLPVLAMVFLLGALGWLPEETLKFGALGGLALGEILLALAVLRNWRHVGPRWMGVPVGVLVDVVILTILALTTLNVIRNIAAGHEAVDVLRNARRMYYYALYFALAGLLARPGNVSRVVDALSVFVILGLASYVFTAATGVELGSRIAATYGPSGPTSGRIYHVVFQTAVVAGFLSFAQLVGRTRVGHRVAPTVAFAVATLLVYLSFYRNYYVTYALGLATIALVATRLRVSQLIRAGLVAAGIAGMLGAALALTGGLDPVLDRVRSIGTELTGTSGTFATRLIIWGIRVEAISQINPLLGAGFIWAQDPARTADEVVLDPLVPDNDNGYAAALVVLGVVGIVLFLLLYLTAAGTAWRLLRRGQVAQEHLPVVHAVLGFLPYVLVNNIGLDNFHWPYAVLPNVALLALLRGVRSPRSHLESPEGSRA